MRTFCRTRARRQGQNAAVGEATGDAEDGARAMHWTGLDAYHRARRRLARAEDEVACEAAPAGEPTFLVNGAAGGVGAPRIDGLAGVWAPPGGVVNASADQSPCTWRSGPSRSGKFLVLNT
jgi:hypothetical protein